MYIGINPESLVSLCEERKEAGVSTLKERGVDTKEERVSSSKVVPITSKVQTNTKTTTNNSTEISNIDFSSNQPSAARDGRMAFIEEIEGRIEYESLKTKYSDDALKTSLLEELISAIEDVLESDSGRYSISKIRVNRDNVVAIFGELTRQNLEYEKKEAASAETIRDMGQKIKKLEKKVEDAKKFPLKEQLELYSLQKMKKGLEWVVAQLPESKVKN